jgi:hypothetical protein
VGLFFDMGFITGDSPQSGQVTDPAGHVEQRFCVLVQCILGVMEAFSLSVAACMVPGRMYGRDSFDPMLRRVKSICKAYC